MDMAALDYLRKWHCYGWAFRDILKFGNKMRVHAVGNPIQTGKQPAILYDRASGCGIVLFNRNTRDITIECWSRWSDPSQPNAKQYPGWPVKINQLENYGRKAYGYLPKIQVAGMNDPVVQVIDQENEEVIYTLRIRGTSFQPWVFKDGIYRVEVGELGTDQVKVLRDLKPRRMVDGAGVVEIKL
jgi:alkaline phosphatase D